MTQILEIKENKQKKQQQMKQNKAKFQTEHFNIKKTNVFRLVVKAGDFMQMQGERVPASRGRCTEGPAPNGEHCE